MFRCYNPPVQGVRFLSIASGSKGNAHLVLAGDDVLLVDCGISARRIEEGVRRAGKSLSDITAVLITHTHNDHISGLWGILRRISPKVYAPAALSGDVSVLGAEFTSLSEREYSLNGTRISAFELSHDAKPTFGFRISAAGREIGMVTDLGTWDEALLSRIEGCDLLLWEANHDENLLRSGRYPAKLKRRIGGTGGHLSNAESLGGITALDRLPGTLLLGHLSHENNTVGRVRDVYASAHIEKHIRVHVLAPGEAGPVFEV